MCTHLDMKSGSCMPTEHRAKTGFLSEPCRIGLGLKWFTVDDRLVIELHLSAEELILCL